MPPKQKTPAPIDRPLSRAYLREFTGWSSAYPPGISDPTSLRIMENVMVQRDGSVRVRPGLRYLSIMDSDQTPIDTPVVGTHEPFFLNDGSKAYLFAVREDDDTVGFRVFANTGLGYVVHELTDAGIDFTVEQGEDVLAFTEATTYVKYLQIDNKIFALSNAGESMRYFTVGNVKTAKALSAIERPAWDPDDKLTVVQPEAGWISSGTPSSVRRNLIPNPSFEYNTDHWAVFSSSYYQRLTASATIFHGTGAKSGRLESQPAMTNRVPNPLTGPVDDLTGWALGSGQAAKGASLGITSGWMRVTYPVSSPLSWRYYVDSPVCTVTEGTYYNLAYDFQRSTLGTQTFGVLWRWYASNGSQIGSDSETTIAGTDGSRPVIPVGTAPAGAVSFRAFFYANMTSSGGNRYFEIRNVRLSDVGTNTAAMDGDSGTNYFWEGTAGNSVSVYHPPSFVGYKADQVDVVAGEDYAFSGHLRFSAGITRNVITLLRWFNSSGVKIGSDITSTDSITDGAWTRTVLEETAPSGAVKAELSFLCTASGGLARGEYLYVDEVMAEKAAVVDDYFDGSYPSISTAVYSWAGTNEGISTETLYLTPGAVPDPETPTTNTLVSSTAADNIYNFGFFYTFSNEIGESAASQVTVVKAQRGWSQWKWETANVDGEPSGTPTNDPAFCADQLVAYMPSTVFAEALAQGATQWTLYALTWSSQDPVPVSAIRLGTRTLTTDSLHGSVGWLAMTPQQADANAEIVALPSETTRFNYSTPSSGGQGLVAADRMIMVYDPAAPAVIRWSSNEMGHYSDFSANRGGGFKTLTSGNLFVPAAVKLWQNPQSADTLTILCLGVDGHSTGYYMAPAQVASQSEAVNIMGFEETTATPGTTSPYGVEVLNNALYHPLDEQLMKSTATNYNINHLSLTDQIQNVWRGLINKVRIVSSQLDNRLYYLVHNPLGEALEDGCWGNEVWVYDAAQKAGSWSRWLVQGQTLRKFQQGDQVVMSLVRPDGIYYFDEGYSSDDYVEGGEVLNRAIPWLLETNTQGANRAHDAWAHLQQANIVVGNFQGTMQYGVRGVDRHGKPVRVTKKLRDSGDPSTDGTLWDLEDFLLIRRDMKEWFFFAGSVTDDSDVTLASSGQINLVQYRYTPVSVNDGYEYGSVETFEYGRAGNSVDSRTTDNGIPMPFIDTGRP